MKKYILAAFLTVTLSLMAANAVAGDVYVDGYYRKNGTYVRPHYRSAPNDQKWDNYGPSQSDNELLNPKSRDFDQDGTPNYQDKDDDNDGILDDSE